MSYDDEYDFEAEEVPLDDVTEDEEEKPRKKKQRRRIEEDSEEEVAHGQAGVPWFTGRRGG